jgi:asparagine synthase (glutamine-hydrolysing)
MCGITGFLTRPASESNDAMAAIVARMSETLALRGPDAQRTWVDDAAGCALGHRRLSIIDLSEHGAQPMHSACGRFVIVFNGEIYNHRELRAELEAARAAPPWRGHSDTEILLAAIAHWGLPGAVARLTGMFAFALWDRQAHALSLVRDRLGEKPLYYGWSSGSFLFGSELKALRAHPDWRGEIDRGALTLFLRYAYVPAPHSIYTGVRKLQPGTILTLHAGIAHGALPEPVPYWNAAEVASAGQRTPFAGSVDDAVNALGAKLGAAVSGQMIADVPLGAFLSGGIDSSTIVALMQSQSARPVKTFTIGFAEDAYDEAAHAAVVARHLGTDHHELYVSAQDALDVIPRLPDMYDEPFADSSQIPTHLVARMARQQVTVSLSGDGGDELFGGYTRHDWTGRLWNSMRRYPQSLRAAAARLATIPSPATWDAVFDALAMLTPRRLHLSHPGEKMHKVAGVLDAGSAQEIYLRLASQWQAPAAVVIDGSEPPLAARAAAAWEIGNDIAHSQMYLDLISYLPDDILVKVDRAAMGISLETRVPFLDRHVVEFAWQLPLAMKIRDGRGKWLLRQLLYKHVPAALVERPKTGFGVPIDSWLRGPLKEWAAALLDPTRLAREGYLHAEPVTRLWQEHLSGRRNHQHALWNVIMFQTWLAAQHAIPHA